MGQNFFLLIFKRPLSLSRSNDLRELSGIDMILILDTIREWGSTEAEDYLWRPQGGDTQRDSIGCFRLRFVFLRVLHDRGRARAWVHVHRGDEAEPAAVDTRCGTHADRR